MILELRQYTLHPGRRDELIDLFEREFLDPQEAMGIRIEGLFRDPDRPDVFVWLRSFPDMETRRQALEAFYGGPVWKRHREAANATMIDSDNVLLLRGDAVPARAGLRGPLFAAVYPGTAALDAARLKLQGMDVLGTWTTETSPNTFPRLPVRDGQYLFALIDGADRELLAATDPAELFELLPASRSRLRFRLDGRPGDFAFLDGRWRVLHRILRKRLQGCTDWEELDDTATHHTLLDGVVSVDEIGIGPRGKGCSFRHLDLQRRRWSIRWVNDRTGSLYPAVHGGFHDGGCELYGLDREDGREVFVRYRWTGCGTDHPRWEQAFSLDGGDGWETNWVMQFSRTT